jgi:hypothetical protein
MTYKDKTPTGSDCEGFWFRLEWDFFVGLGGLFRLALSFKDRPSGEVGKVLTLPFSALDVELNVHLRALLVKLQKLLNLLLTEEVEREQGFLALVSAVVGDLKA